MRKIYANQQISKKLINIFFNNLNLILMQQYLRYKNLDKMRKLLKKLLYNKVIW